MLENGNTCKAKAVLSGYCLFRTEQNYAQIYFAFLCFLCRHLMYLYLQLPFKVVKTKQNAKVGGGI